MRLVDLEPTFLRVIGESSSTRTDDIDEAQGLLFHCPQCFGTNGTSSGTHSVICWFMGRGVPDDRAPGPGRWLPTGTGYDDLTLSPSIRLTDGCGWHGYITNGEVRDA